MRLAADRQAREIDPVPVAGGEFGYALTEFVEPVRAPRALEVGIDAQVRLSMVLGIIESARTGQPVACDGPFVSK